MAFEVIETQEQLDKVIGERISRLKEQYAGYEDYKAKAEQYDTLKKDHDSLVDQVAEYTKLINGDDENEGYKKQLESMQSKLKGYETNSVKMRIAHENGIPFELASKLSGENEDEIKKDAETMAKFLKSKHVPPLASSEKDTNEKKEALKKMLSGLKGE